MHWDADVIIVGGGPAGLSAALILARACRRVLVFDHDCPRNGVTSAVHGFLTRDGVAPTDLRRLAQADLAQYDDVRLIRTEVSQAYRLPEGGFAVEAGGMRCTARALLLATGVRDRIPSVPGLADLYGRSVFHCPYCDGWELRRQPLAVYGSGARGYGLALELLGWTPDIVLFTDGDAGLSRSHRDRLVRLGIGLREERVERVEGEDGQLRRVVLASGESVDRRALFFTTGQVQCSDLAAALGCEFNDKGTVRTGPYESTHIPGLYVAGDASRAVQWVVVAAAEGAEAAFAINQDLLEADRREPDDASEPPR